MNYLLIAFALFFFPLPGVSFQAVHEKRETASWLEVAHFARETLPQEGQLVMNSDGFGYLKVDDAYIHTLFPMLGLKSEGYKEPPYFRSEDSPGAHISIFYVDEHVSPEEVGQTFSFHLKKIKIVHPSHKVSYAVFEVESHDLEHLREKYGLNPKLHGHEFHISLAKKTLHK